jgi:hypothetical protein
MGSSDFFIVIFIIAGLGIVFSLITRRDEEYLKYKIYSSGDDSKISEYKNQVIKNAEKRKRKRFYLGLALLLAGILIIAFQYFQYQNSINNSVIYSHDTKEYSTHALSYTSLFGVIMNLGFISIFSGIALITYFLLAKSENQKPELKIIKKRVRHKSLI